MITQSSRILKADNALDAEQRVLCAMLMDANRIPIVLAKLKSQDFSTPETRALFEIIKRIHAQGHQVDIDRVRPELGQSPYVDNAHTFLADIFESVATSVHAEHDANRVLECSRKRRLYAIGSDLCLSSKNGKPANEIIDHLVSKTEDLRRTVGNYDSPFKAITAKQLDSSNYKIDYAIENVLALDQPCILAGPKKCLKTTLLVDLGISLANQSCFLGKFSVPSQKRFLLCSSESGLATLQETSRRVAKSKGKQLSELDSYFITDAVPRFDNKQSMDSFGDMISSKGIEIVAIDPAYLCMSGDDAGNLFKQGAMLKEIAELCQKQGATLILAHHTKKSVAEPHQAPELDGIAWSGFQEFARQWILLGRREKYEPGTGNHKLWLAVGGSAGHGGLWGLDVDEGTNTAVEGRQWQINLRSSGEITSLEQKQRKQQKQQQAEARKQEQLEADRLLVLVTMQDSGYQQDDFLSIHAGQGILIIDTGTAKSTVFLQV